MINYNKYIINSLSFKIMSDTPLSGYNIFWFDERIEEIHPDLYKGTMDYLKDDESTKTLTEAHLNKITGSDGVKINIEVHHLKNIEAYDEMVEKWLQLEAGESSPLSRDNVFVTSG